MATPWRTSMVVTEAASGRLEVATFCIYEDPVVPGSGDLDAQTVADDVHDWLADLWKATMRVECQLTTVQVRELGTDTPTAAEHVDGGAGDIAAPASYMPHTVCARASIKTDVATRSGRGRFHFPSPVTPTFLSSPDLWNMGSTYIVACQAVLDALLSGHTVSHDSLDHHYSLRVWSRKENAAYDVTSGKIQQGVSSLRTRLTSP